MPPRIPGQCSEPNCHLLAGPSGKCWYHADTAPLPPDLPPADDDTWSVPPVPRPQEPHGLVTFDCDVRDSGRAESLIALGYCPTGKTKGPYVMVWAKRLDEGC